MTTTAVALTAGVALCLLAVVALCVLVAVLRGQVRRLSSRLDEFERQVGAQPEPRPEQAPVAGPSRGLAVPVITALATDRREVESAPSGWRVASVTLAEPLIKVMSFSYGLRRALDEERRLRYRLAVRKELRRQRKLRRQRRLRPVHQGWRS